MGLDDTLTYEEMRSRLVSLLHPEHDVDNVLVAIRKVHVNEDLDLLKQYPELPRSPSQFYLQAIGTLSQYREEHPTGCLGSWVIDYPYGEHRRRARLFFKPDIRTMRILGVV